MCAQFTWTHVKVPFENIVRALRGQRWHMSSKSLDWNKAADIQNMLKVWSVDGYSELMFQHILCHHHYWHRPGVIRARMLVTQRQFCMTSSNDAKTDKSAQIRESKFSSMTQWQFCMITGIMTPRRTKVLPIQTNANFARMSINSIQNFSMAWRIYVRESYFFSVSI